MANALPALRINGQSNVFEEYGVSMGEGFIDALTEPLSLKSFIENESRLENGKRIIVNEPKISSRDVTLDFVLIGKTPEDLEKKKKAFLALIYKGEVTIQVPQVNSDVYHLVYTGKGSTYGLSLTRTLCHMMLKFEEPNPAHRIEADENNTGIY